MISNYNGLFYSFRTIFTVSNYLTHMASDYTQYGTYLSLGTLNFRQQTFYMIKFLNCSVTFYVFPFFSRTIAIIFLFF